VRLLSSDRVPRRSRGTDSEPRHLGARPIRTPAACGEKSLRERCVRPGSAPHTAPPSCVRYQLLARVPGAEPSGTRCPIRWARSPLSVGRRECCLGRAHVCYIACSLDTESLSYTRASAHGGAIASMPCHLSRCTLSVSRHDVNTSVRMLRISPAVLCRARGMGLASARVSNAFTKYRSWALGDRDQSRSEDPPSAPILAEPPARASHGARLICLAAPRRRAPRVGHGRSAGSPRNSMSLNGGPAVLE
jgi:hypothetical protein